jgi:pSer/pThr/pTyr-binding forkhead associated (FHA) protein
MDVVLVMFKDGERREFPISIPKTILGRRQDCQLRIPTKDVSRHHCALLTDGTKLTVKDLGSSNGTFVNGKRVAASELKAGDRLRLGPVTFVVQVDGKPAEIKPEDVAPPSTAVPTPAGEDEETFDLNDVDFDLSDIGKPDDDDDMP